MALKETSRASQQRIQALADFRYTLRKFLHFSEDAATEAGLTPQQHQLLLQLAAASPAARTTIAWLADRLTLRHHSVVELCTRCEDAGLITRGSDPHDRRLVVLRLTAEGSRILQTLTQAHARELHELGPRLIESLKLFTL